MLPFAWPYPPEQKNGYWGIPTSTIDWCEENYVVSKYIAEAVNTTTNSAFIILALFSIYHAIHNKLEPRFIFTAFGFLLVGIGSWLFHMTLKYHFQLLDELPMIYATCIPFGPYLVSSKLQDNPSWWPWGFSRLLICLLSYICILETQPSIKLHMGC